MILEACASGACGGDDGACCLFFAGDFLGENFFGETGTRNVALSSASDNGDVRLSLASMSAAAAEGCCERCWGELVDLLDVFLMGERDVKYVCARLLNSPRWERLAVFLPPG